MRVTIDEETCIGCGACEAACSEVFYMQDDKAKVKTGVNLQANADCIKEAAETCPVECIKVED